MKRLHTFILGSYLWPFVTTFFICMFVLIMQFLWRYIDDFVGKGLDFSIIVEMLGYTAVTLIPMALPLAVLLSSLMTFGNLGENYELIALKSAGISLYRIMQPLIIFISFLTIAAFFFSNNVLPHANLKFYSLLYDIRHQKPELAFKDGVFTNDLEGYSIKVDYINKNTGMMYNVLIYNHKDVYGNYEVTKADSGIILMHPEMKLMSLELFHGQTYTDEGMVMKGKNNFPFRRLKFVRQKMMLEMPDSDLKRTDEELFRGNSVMLNLSQLSYTIDSVNNLLEIRSRNIAERMLVSSFRKHRDWNLASDSVFITEAEPVYEKPLDIFRDLDPERKEEVLEQALFYARDAKERINEDELYAGKKEEYVIRSLIEWHKKFTLSFACLVFFFIGAPLGAIIRKGGLGMPVVVSVLLFIVYWVISMIGERSAREAVITPFLGTWISSMILLPMGILLTYKSVTDSEIMNIEAYTLFFKKIKMFFKLERKDV